MHGKCWQSELQGFELSFFLFFFLNKTRHTLCETLETFFQSLCKRVSYSAFQFQTCLFLVQRVQFPLIIIIHSWKQIVQGIIWVLGEMTEYPSFSIGGICFRYTACHWSLHEPKWCSVPLWLFVIPAEGAITNLIYLTCCCEHTHLRASCKTDLRERSISVWWFYFSLFLHAKNKYCKKCEMRSHFPHGSIICRMRWHDCYCTSAIYF